MIGNPTPNLLDLLFTSCCCLILLHVPGNRIPNLKEPAASVPRVTLKDIPLPLQVQLPLL